MDNEMIARVSDAILNTPNASDYKTLVAINAIKVMREPTEKMLEKVYELRATGDDFLHKSVYQKMIDAIIGEE